MKTYPINLLVLLFALLFTSACQNGDREEDRSMVVLASLDGLGDYMFRNDYATAYLETAARVADQGVLSRGMLASFPSNTTNSHAAMYTGTYGNLNGISAGNLLLPREDHTIFEHKSGFHSSLLQVEPIWMSAARQGKKVLAIQTTQMYPFLDHLTASDTPRPPALVTGYGPPMLSQPRMLYQEDMEKPASLPSGLNVPASALDPILLYWQEGPFTLYAAITADNGMTGYNRFHVNAGHDQGWVKVEAHPEEDEFPVGRPLARYFSDDVLLPAEDGSIRSVTNYRLYDLCPETAAFELFQPAFHEVAIHDATGNEAEVVQELYQNAGGFLGNGPSFLWRDGVFGDQLYAGGDGTAELRYLEGAELLIRQSNRYSEWLTARYQPDLLLDYSPYPDETDHWFYGFVRNDITGFDPRLSEQYDHYRAWAFAALDQRAELLDRLAGPDGHFIVVGDHGMTAAHKTVYVNEILRRNGLLEVDANNRIMPHTVKAYHINSSAGVLINTSDWKGGIVDPADRDAMVDKVEGILEEVRDPWTGEPVFARFFRASEFGDSLGIGGPADMDLYYDLAPGYIHDRAVGVDEVVAILDVPKGVHSLAPTRDEMLCFFAARGPLWEEPRQIPTIRIVDMALLISDMLGIDPPGQSIGRPLDSY